MNAPQNRWLPPEPGIHAIIGECGVGKTKLLRCMPGNPLVATEKRAIERIAQESPDRVDMHSMAVRDFVKHWITKAFPSYEWPDQYSLYHPLMCAGIVRFLHVLYAVVLAEVGQISAFSSLGGEMSPHAIQTLFEAFRSWCERAKEDITVVIETHSPVVLDQFNVSTDSSPREGPEHVWVIQAPGAAPRRLTEIHTEVWLSRYRIGSSLFSSGVLTGPV